jgi:hypothetical protein
MNSKTWRKNGYRTVFNGKGDIYLWEPGQHLAYHARIDNGQWMTKNNLEEFDNIGIDDLPHINWKDIEENCYCDYAGIDCCDVCTGLRRRDNSIY